MSTLLLVGQPDHNKETMTITLLVLTNTILVGLLAVFLNMLRQRNQVITSMLEALQKTSRSHHPTERNKYPFDYQTEETFQNIIEKFDWE